VGHVAHEVGTARVCNGAEAGIVPLTGVRATSADDHLRLEELNTLLELLVVEKTRLRIHLRDQRGDCWEGGYRVGQRLEVVRRGGDGLALAILGGRVVAMRQMPATGKVKSHHAVVGAQKSCVHGEVGGTAAVGLHIDTPRVLVELERGESTLTAERLDLLR
jgi:hypothetical protein